MSRLCRGPLDVAGDATGLFPGAAESLAGEAGDVIAFRRPMTKGAHDRTRGGNDAKDAHYQGKNSWPNSLRFPPDGFIKARKLI